jgi:uncharacterized damage-inducible protein DinB
MSGRRTSLIEALQADAAATCAFFEGLTPDQLATQVYQDGAAWTARQVLAHLVTIENSMQRLFRDILAGIPDSSKGFDIERFNRTQPQKLKGLGLAELIARFQAVRAHTIATLEAMTESDLDREGWHPFHGAGRLERFVRWAFEHSRGHVDDIRRKLKAPCP